MPILLRVNVAFPSVASLASGNFDEPRKFLCLDLDVSRSMVARGIGQSPDGILAESPELPFGPGLSYSQ